MRNRLVMLLAIGCAVSACAVTPASPQASPRPTGPVAVPPDERCVPPNVEELQTLEQASDFVVQASVGANSWTALPSGNGSEYATTLTSWAAGLHLEFYSQSLRRKIQ